MGRGAEAIAGVEEVARIQERQEAFEQLAQTRFLLARVLWQEPRRRGDSIALAETALDSTNIEVRRREIEAWLRGRGVVLARARSFPKAPGGR